MTENKKNMIIISNITTILTAQHMYMINMTTKANKHLFKVETKMK